MNFQIYILGEVQVEEFLGEGQVEDNFQINLI